MTSNQKDFIRERVCFYSPAFPEKTSGRHIIEMALRYGAAGVEMLSFWDELKRGEDTDEALKLGRYAKANGLHIPCFSLGTELVGKESERGKSLLYRAIDVCSELEIPYLHHTIFMSLDPNSICGRREEIIKRGIEAALILNERARARGVRTLVENQGLIFNGLESYNDFILATQKAVGTVLDLGNIMFVDECAEVFAAGCIGDICHVHLKDYIIRHRCENIPNCKHYITKAGNFLIPCEFGRGSVNFTAVKNILSKIGYKGYFSLEFDRVMNDEMLNRSIDYISTVMA